MWLLSLVLGAFLWQPFGGQFSFTLQLAAYTSRAEAAQRVAALEQAGVDSQIEEASVRGKLFYRLRTGNFPTQNEARAAGQELLRRGLASQFLVVPVPSREVPEAHASREGGPSGQWEVMGERGGWQTLLHRRSGVRVDCASGWKEEAVGSSLLKSESNDLFLRRRGERGELLDLFWFELPGADSTDWSPEAIEALVEMVLQDAGWRQVSPAEPKHLGGQTRRTSYHVSGELNGEIEGQAQIIRTGKGILWIFASGKQADKLINSVLLP